VNAFLGEEFEHVALRPADLDLADAACCRIGVLGDQWKNASRFPVHNVKWSWNSGMAQET
jgi:hypothetical protein